MPQAVTASKDRPITCRITRFRVDTVWLPGTARTAGAGTRLWKAGAESRLKPTDEVAVSVSVHPPFVVAKLNMPM